MLARHVAGAMDRRRVRPLLDHRRRSALDGTGPKGVGSAFGLCDVRGCLLTHAPTASPNSRACACRHATGQTFRQPDLDHRGAKRRRRAQHNPHRLRRAKARIKQRVAADAPPRIVPIDALRTSEARPAERARHPHERNELPAQCGQSYPWDSPSQSSDSRHQRWLGWRRSRSHCLRRRVRLLDRPLAHGHLRRKPRCVRGRARRAWRVLRS
jgi:hypothetical protein